MTHPLDKAINNATFANPTLTPLECLPNNTPSEWLLDLTRAAAETFFPQTRRAHLRSIAIDTHNWLQTLGLPDPWQAMRDEYDRAKAKHGDHTLDTNVPTDEERYYAVIEEIGEIARALTYDQEHAGELTHEITQLGGLALAWLTHELNQEQK